MESVGLSPRGRGNLESPQSPVPDDGSIPAWAGEPVGRLTLYDIWWVYPRVGGGTPSGSGLRSGREGLSPRGRGNRARHTVGPPRPGSIPAWAGEPFGVLTPGGVAAVYPRVGGGTASTSALSTAVSGLSPRGRGNQLPRLFNGGMERSIPAWAGEPLHLHAGPAAD